MSAAEGSSLSARTIRAGMWTVGARLSSRLIDFAVLMVLVRLLGPADFGLVATAMTVIYIVEAILELPLAVVLVRQPEVTERMYNTAFTLGLIRGLLVAAIMAAFSFPLASLYSDARLAPLICALALAPAARGMFSPRMVVFDRAMDFRRKGMIELLGKAAAAMIAISVAVATDNYWAVAAGTVSNPVFTTIFSYMAAPMRPRLSLADWPLFYSMLGWNFVSQAVSAFNWQVDRLLLPLRIDTVSFGRFTTASDVASLPYQAIMAPAAAPLFSALVNAREKGNIERAYLKACSGIVTVMAPVLCFMGLMAKPAVYVILGPSWIDGAPILEAIALMNLVYLPAMPMSSLVMVLGRPRIIALRSGIELFFRTPLTFAGIALAGIPGAIAARFATGVVLLVADLMFVRSVGGIPIGRQLHSSLYPFMALLPAGLFLYCLPDLTQLGTVLYPAIAAAGLCFSAIYAAAIIGLWWIRGRPEGLESHVAGKISAYVRR